MIASWDRVESKDVFDKAMTDFECFMIELNAEYTPMGIICMQGDCWPENAFFQLSLNRVYFAI